MKILITKEHVLAAIAESEKGGLPTDSCAMYQALRPFIKENFSVVGSEAHSNRTDATFHFDRHLPVELYDARYDEALSQIEEHGPYEFEVSGL